MKVFGREWGTDPGFRVDRFNYQEDPFPHYELVRVGVRKRWPGWVDFTGVSETCDGCGVHHLAWVVDDTVWSRLPEGHRRKRLCVRCFLNLSKS